MYIFRMSIGVTGFLLITVAWRYGDIELGVGILVMFSFVWIDLGIIINMPPLAGVGLDYQLCLYVVLLELFCIT